MSTKHRLHMLEHVRIMLHPHPLPSKSILFNLNVKANRLGKKNYNWINPTDHILVADRFLQNKDYASQPHLNFFLKSMDDNIYIIIQ